MTVQADRPITILIAALGGEGGGVLTNWIVAAARDQGLPVQATSIPGVAQRTGATTYYIEVWPQSIGSGRNPVLALSPTPGEIDIVVTTELLEAGRCILNGFVTPDRTHLIASNHRVYTTFEKMVAGDGRFDSSALIRASAERSQDSRLLDLDVLARASGSRINAVLLGVLAGSKKLPLSEQALADAIRDGGKAVEVNLNGFAAGLAATDEDMDANVSVDIAALIAGAEARLTAYQGKDYARLYRDRMQGIDGAADELQIEVAKGLARRMAYEDIIRVAQLKTRPGRLAALTGGTGAGNGRNGGEVVHITEYFRPGLKEICDILPAPLARRILAWAEAKSKRLLLSWPMALRSTTLSGFLMLKLLAALRPIRRVSYRYQCEQTAINAWLSDISRAQKDNPALALEIARNARLIKGYGSTLARARAAYDTISDDLVASALRDQNGSADKIAIARQDVLRERPD